jgi:hypothetical protein
LPLEEEEPEGAQVIPLLQVQVEQGLFVEHLGAMVEHQVEDVQPEVLVVVLVAQQQLMVRVEPVGDCQVEAEQRDLEVVFLVKPGP